MTNAGRGIPRIRARNTAFVQLALAGVCVVVAGLVVFAGPQRGAASNSWAAVILLLILAKGAVQRGRRTFRQLAERLDAGRPEVTEAERIRIRNTALVQLATGVACVIVASLVVVAGSRPGGVSNTGNTILLLLLLAVWMLERSRSGFRRLGS